jgi:hypothetical protein
MEEGGEDGGGFAGALVGATRIAVAGGVTLADGGTTMGGTAIVGVGAGVLAFGAGAGVGAGRRDSGTSGATGPCRSGAGDCDPASEGRRKPLTEGGAAASGTARVAAAVRARGIERISVAAGMAGRGEQPLNCARQSGRLCPRRVRGKSVGR